MPSKRRNMAKGRVDIKTENCKSCLYCIGVCPKKVLGLGGQINSKGYEYVQAIHPEDCIGCAMCATMCPEAVITVYRD